MDFISMYIQVFASNKMKGKFPFTTLQIKKIEKKTA